MKKIFITVLCILVFALIMIIVITNFSSLGRNNKLNKAKEMFLKDNKNVSINSINIYYEDKTYYIIMFDKNKVSYLEVLDKKYKKVITVEKDKLFNLKKDSIIGYKDDKLIYEVKKNTKYGFTYSYYDALTGDFIKNIKLNK